MAAPVCVILRREIYAWVVALLVSWLCLGLSFSILVQVLDTGTIVYELGGWAAPWGIEYRIDLLAAFVAVIVSGIGALVAPYAHASVIKEVDRDRTYLFYTMYLLCMTGLLGMTITGDAFNLFVFLEVASLSTYVLLSLGRDRRALTAAYRYLVLGTVGATFYVLGVGLIYMATGTLNMADMASLIPAVESSRTILLALAFLTVGITMKLALFPLHVWLPNAYAYAPSTVTAFLAATATKVSIYIILRIVFTIFGGATVMVEHMLAPVLMVLAIMAMFAGSLVAVWQTNLKRMLAYSSVAQVGYIMLGISLVSTIGVAGGILHLFNHALMKCALFLALGCVFYRVGSVRIDDLAGIAKSMPLTMAAFVVGGLSLIGVPTTVGFVSKWFLISAAFERGYWIIPALVVMSSMLAVAYVWKVVEAAYLKPRPEGAPEVSEAPMIMLVPTWILAGACVFFGIDASGTGQTALDAAAQILGGGR